MNELRPGRATCTCGHERHATRLIAVTGGPGGGKSAVLELATRLFCEHVGILPEAASILFGGGFPRHDTPAGLRATQRAIFHVQRQVETLVVEEGKLAIGLCDRGTVDGLAYWPGDAGAYWAELQTTLEAELARYAAVIHMRTPTLARGYDHSNALRVESAAEAAELDAKIAGVWAGHPRRFFVDNRDDFMDKAREALDVLRSQLPPCCRKHPLV